MWRSEKAELRGGVKGKGMVVEAWRLRGPGVPRAYGPPSQLQAIVGNGSHAVDHRRVRRARISKRAGGIADLRVAPRIAAPLRAARTGKVAILVPCSSAWPISTRSWRG